MPRKADQKAVEQGRTKNVRLLESADAFEAFVSAKIERRAAGKRKRRLTSSEKLVDEIAEMQARDDWSGMGPNHLVELYGLLHREVYGVEADELRDRKVRLAAIARAKSVLTKELKGGPEAVRFVRWAWRREALREKRTKENGNGEARTRMGWRLLFSRAVLVDYRVDLGRGKA